MTTDAQDERAALADALDSVGPDAATLCAGWTTRDLAAHLVARENRPDASLGMMLPPLAGYTERVRLRYAAGDYAGLVSRIRSGPPRTSLYALPKLDSAFNLAEFLIHGDDVRRAQPGWSPRELPDGRQAAIWRLLSGRGGRFMLRRVTVGVAVVDTSGRRAVLTDRQPSVTITGAPHEVLLYVTGRREVAQVQLDGTADALAQLRETKLAL